MRLAGAVDEDLPAGLRQINTLMTWIANLFATLGVLGIFALLVIINADILARNLRGAPINGVPELVRLGIVSIVFLLAAKAIGGGHLTRSDTLVNGLLSNQPGIRSAIELLFCAIGALFFGMIAWSTYPMILSAYASGDFVGSRALVAVPTWPAKSIVFIGSVFATAQFVLNGILVLVPSGGRDATG